MTQITKHFLSGKESVFGQGNENVTKLFSNEGLTIDNETLFIVQDFVVAVNKTKDISESLGEMTLQNILTGFKNFTKVQLIFDPDIQFGLNDTILPEEKDLLLKIKSQINMAAEKVAQKCSTTLCIQNITASDNILPTEFTDLGDLLSREMCELTALLQRIVRSGIMQEFLGVSSLGNLPLGTSPTGQGSLARQKGLPLGAQLDYLQGQLLG